MKCRKELLLLFALPYLNGCGILSSQANGMCTMEARPALQVSVVDARTGNSILNGATVTAREEQFVDSVQVKDWMTPAIGLAHERSGKYELIVQKPGYKTWSEKGIKVKKGECHVEPVKIEVQLEKEST